MKNGEAAGRAIAKWAHNNPRLYALIVWSVVIGILAGGVWVLVNRFSEGKVFSTAAMIVVIVIAGLTAKKKPTETPE
jgi:uncharacterized membrane protein